MPGLTFKRIDGIIGSVVIPEIGLEIGTMLNWALVRREETPPELGEWDLHATFSFLNEYAFHAPEWKKEYLVTLGNRRRGRQYRLVPTTGRTALAGHSLLIEGIELHGIDEAN